MDEGSQSHLGSKRRLLILRCSIYLTAFLKRAIESQSCLGSTGGCSSCGVVSTIIAITRSFRPTLVALKESSRKA